MYIKELWKNTELYMHGKIELIPTEWVWKYRGADVLPVTDLMNGEVVDLDTLWKNICDEGLHEPFIMRIGIKNRKFRLESGNHRIQLFHKHGIKMIPVTVQVREECGPHVKDVMTRAHHNFDFGEEVLVLEDNVNELDKYIVPSEVFKSLSLT
ncbi:MAG: hypothetical protein K9M11_02450 [Candidatus Pacebacteria bacterium]|nr:hypothetical protein [Candidatus Paceibacterota bacterium]